MGLTPEELSQQIKDARAKQEQEANTLAPPKATPDDTATGKAVRAATDLVAALVVGGGLGYWLDGWLHTRPMFMIVLFFAGFAAGFLNIYRSQTGQTSKTGPSKDTGEEDKGKKE